MYNMIYRIVCIAIVFSLISCKNGSDSAKALRIFKNINRVSENHEKVKESKQHSNWGLGTIIRIDTLDINSNRFKILILLPQDTLNSIALTSKLLPEIMPNSFEKDFEGELYFFIDTTLIFCDTIIYEKEI